ncbi:MAG: type IV pilus assembly protein PilM [Candidatus Paceibacterota bacterium]
MIFKIFQNSYLGIDIGSTSIKIVEISKRVKRLEMTGYGVLEKYGHLERINDAVQTPSLKLLEETTALLIRDLLKRSKIKTQEALMSLPNFLAFTTAVEFPYMPLKDLQKAIKFQAEQYIPMPLKEVTLDWQVLEETPQKIQVLLIAVPSENIQRYIKTAELAKLTLKSLELEATAVCRLFGLKEKNPVLIIDIGGRVSSLMIMDGGVLRSLIYVEVGGGEFTQIISNALSINPLRAEQLKKAYGFNLNFQEGIDLLRVINPLLERISKEGEKMINGYYLKSKKKIEKIFLIGGGSNMIGIDNYFSQRLGVPAKIIDPFSLELISYPSDLAPVIKEIGPILTVACALGAKPLM